MAEKSKKKSPRKAGHSPMPKHVGGGSPCGHSGCKLSCAVRYCGPTSHLYHHHAYTAARGVENIWLATIVAGLALLVTGVIAFQAAQASAEGERTARDQEMRGELIREIRSMKDQLNYGG